LTAQYRNGTTSDFSREVSKKMVTNPPVSQFYSTEASESGLLGMQFFDTSLHAPESWLWHFGDGTTSRDQHPFHVYQKSGFYSVSLTTTNDLGTDTITNPQLIDSTAFVNLSETNVSSDYPPSQEGNIDPTNDFVGDGSCVDVNNCPQNPDQNLTDCNGLFYKDYFPQGGGVEANGCIWNYNYYFCLRKSRLTGRIPPHIS